LARDSAFNDPGAPGVPGLPGVRPEVVRRAKALRLLLVGLLRFAGCVLLLAFGAMFLPQDWMASTHEWLGMGTFPRSPVVDYLTRSVAALYGFHGGLMLVVAGNPERYSGIVRYFAFLNVALGLILVGIDMHAGMPGWWTLGEGPPIIAFGIVIGVLSLKLETGELE
jgi:hypothetical protein